MPTCSARPGFGLAITHNTTDEEVGIIERRTMGMEQGIAQLAAFMNRSGGFGGRVAGDSSGP